MILRVGGILCALILLYALYQYGWTASRRFTNPIASLLYFGVPAGMAGLMFAALRLKPSRKIGLVMFLVATVFSIHLVNLVLAVFHVKLTNSNSTLWFAQATSKKSLESQKNWACRLTVGLKSKLSRICVAKASTPCPRLSPWLCLLGNRTVLEGR